MSCNVLSSFSFVLSLLRGSDAFSIYLLCIVYFLSTLSLWSVSTPLLHNFLFSRCFVCIVLRILSFLLLVSLFALLHRYGIWDLVLVTQLLYYALLHMYILIIFNSVTHKCGVTYSLHYDSLMCSNICGELSIWRMVVTIWQCCTRIRLVELMFMNFYKDCVISQDLTACEILKQPCFQCPWW